MELWEQREQRGLMKSLRDAVGASQEDCSVDSAGEEEWVLRVCALLRGVVGLQVTQVCPRASPSDTAVGSEVEAGGGAPAGRWSLMLPPL